MKKHEHLFKKAESPEEGLRRLIDIIKILRSPGGCPWDAAQNHKTVRNCIIEEAYEVAEAIDKEDMDNLCEELGDVLMQVIFHGNIMEENGINGITDIENRVCDKMINRHPHVFLEDKEETSEQTIDKVYEKWENIKREEHSGETLTENIRRVPDALPALIKSYKVQKKVARVGFDWNSISGPLDKLKEETEELNEALGNGDKRHIKEELGDLLFTVVNIARFLEIDPEEALNATTEKFINRFDYIEKSAISKGQSLESMSLNDMDLLWEEAKNEL